LKFSFTILLFIVTSFSHLNIVEWYQYSTHPQNRYLNKSATDSSKQEEDTTQKDNKEKSEDQVKYCVKNFFLHQRFFVLFNGMKFIITNTNLNIHPYTDDIIQPPETV
jgi:hypothetical protein